MALLSIQLEPQPVHLGVNRTVMPGERNIHVSLLKMQRETTVMPGERNTYVSLLKMQRETIIQI